MAFACLLADKTSVTSPLIDIYRQRPPPYKVLVHRITATDLIIDWPNRPIAHQIYRLTADKIAVVERGSTPDGGKTR